MGADYYNDTDDPGELVLTLRVADGHGRIHDDQHLVVDVPPGAQVYANAEMENVKER